MIHSLHYKVNELSFYKQQVTYFGLKKNQLTKWKKNIIAQTFLPLSDLIRK